MRYAVVNFKLKSNNISILNALIFERKEKNTFGLMFNRSIKKSLHYEKQLLKLLDGKYGFMSVVNGNSETKVFNLKYPFENIKEYIDNFNFTPIQMDYEEKQANSISDVDSILEKFTTNDIEDIAYIDNFNYGSLFKSNSLNITLNIDRVNVKEKVKYYLLNDVRTVAFTIENLYNNMGLDVVPVKLIKKLNDLINDLVNSATISESQLSKVNLAFINNCVKTVIHLPKTEDVNSNVHHFSNTINRIPTNTVELNVDNQNIYSNIVDLLDNFSIDELKIEIDNETIEINEEQSKKLSEKIQTYKKEKRDSLKADYSKLVIPYEYNTYSNSFMGIDKDLNIHVYYVDSNIIDKLWVLKDKIIDTNARALLVQLEKEEVAFIDFKNNIIKIEGKYRSKSTADVNDIIYVIPSDVK